MNDLMVDELIITGTLEISLNFDGEISESVVVDDIVIDGELELGLVIDGGINTTVTIDGVLGNLYLVSPETYSIYTGEYEVFPDLSEHILETDDKIMENDVTVHRVPSWETANLYGGETFIIGG